MAKILNLPPPYWPPPRHLRGYKITHGASGAIITKLTARHAHGPSPDYIFWREISGIALPAYRRWWLHTLSTSWKTELTNAQRTAWTTLAVGVTIINAAGKSHTPNGFQLFHFYNDFTAHLDGKWPPYDLSDYAMPIKSPPPTWDPPVAPHIVSTFAPGLGNLYVTADNNPAIQPHWTTGAWRRAPTSHPSSRPGQYVSAQVHGYGGTPPNADFFMAFNNVPGNWRLPLWLTVGVRYLSNPNLVPGPLGWITAYVT